MSVSGLYWWWWWRYNRWGKTSLTAWQCWVRQEDGLGCGANLRARPEQTYHDQRMREADLGAVHRAVPRALEHGEHVMVLWVEDDTLDRGLRCGVSASSGSISRFRLKAGQRNHVLLMRQIS